MCKGLYRLKVEEAVVTISKKRSILLNFSGWEPEAVITIEYLRPPEICFSTSLSHTEEICVPVLGVDRRLLICQAGLAHWDRPYLWICAANRSDW